MKLLRVIPSGSNTRVFIDSARECPVIASIAWPSKTKASPEYWKRVPGVNEKRSESEPILSFCKPVVCESTIFAVTRFPSVSPRKSG